MKYLILLSGLMSVSVQADYSMKALTACQIVVEVAGLNNGFNVVSHKIKGKRYGSVGSYAEFIVSVNGELAKVKCKIGSNGAVKYLKLGDNLIIGG